MKRVVDQAKLYCYFSILTKTLPGTRCALRAPPATGQVSLGGPELRWDKLRATSGSQRIDCRDGGAEAHQPKTIHFLKYVIYLEEWMAVIYPPRSFRAEIYEKGIKAKKASSRGGFLGK